MSSKEAEDVALTLNQREFKASQSLGYEFHLIPGTKYYVSTQIWPFPLDKRSQLLSSRVSETYSLETVCGSGLPY